MKVYFISGLAADYRVFRNIQLPPGHEAAYLHWITPLKNESLKQYALRMAGHIDTQEDFILLGLSMGGMIAVEIANHLHPLKTVIISSVPCSSQLPNYLRIGGRLKLHKLLPVGFLKKASIIKRYFTAESEKDKVLLRQLIRESDPAFIRWALDAIVNWESDCIPPNLVHIHGGRDELLPARFTQPHHIISRAGHLMVMDKAGEISEILRRELMVDKLMG